MIKTYINDIIYFYSRHKSYIFTKYNFDYISYANDVKNCVLPIESTIIWNYDSYTDPTTDPGIIFQNFINYNQYLFGFGKGVIYNTSNTNDFKTNALYWSSPHIVHPALQRYFFTDRSLINNIINYLNNYGFCLNQKYRNSYNVPFKNDSYKESLTGDALNLYSNWTDLVQLQFNMINYTDDEIIRCQNFYYMDANHLYTKYNFKFDTYSNFFKITRRSKLAIFTNFVVRLLNLNHNVLVDPETLNGYGPLIFDDIDFSIFFNINQQNSNLTKYLSDNGVMSIRSDVYNSTKRIDWLEYKKTNKDLNNMTNTELINHWYKFGQFEQRTMKFIPFEKPFGYDLVGSVGTIIYIDINKNIHNIGSCFLFNLPNDSKYGHNDPNITNQPDMIGQSLIYLMTTYRMLKNLQNINVIYAIFQTIDPDTYIPISTTIAFNLIGYDVYLDVLVAIYDPNINYNIEFGVNILPYNKLEIDFEMNYELNTNLYAIDDIFNEKSLLSGYIVDINYVGEYENTVLGIPQTILAKMYATDNIIGGPIFNLSNNKFKLVGMINGFVDSLDKSNESNKLNKLNPFCTVIETSILSYFANNVIQKYNTIIKDITFNSFIDINELIKNQQQKSWLGIICSNFNRYDASYINDAFEYFLYTGGIIVHDFIIGLDFVKDKFITDSIELTEQNIIQLNTPLLNTQMYKKFIENDRTPMVIKSIVFYNGMKSEFEKYYFGIYSNQVSYGKFIFDFLPISTEFDTKQQKIINLYQTIKIEYYWFDGFEWHLTEENVGDNLPESYSTYIDKTGQIYYQHNFEFPNILIPYMSSYITTINSDINFLNNNKSTIISNSTTIAFKSVKSTFKSVKSTVKSTKK